MGLLILALKKFATEALQYWKELLAVIIIAILMYGSYDLGRSKKVKIYEDQIKAAQEANLKAHEKFEEEKIHIAQQYESWRQTHPVIKNVVSYVSVKSDAACKVPVGFVKLHEESLYRTFNTSSNNDDDSSIKLSTVGDVISSNYHICLNEMKKLESLQEIVRAYQNSQK